MARSPGKRSAEILAAEYSQHARSYARYWGPVINPMAIPLLDEIPLNRAEHILDVGCGTGGLWPLIRRAAPAARLWGVDRSAGMLQAGGDLLRGRTVVMEADRLGLRAAWFDVALLLFVLFHIPDPVGALREVRSTLKPMGTLGLTVWGGDPGLPGVSIWTEELDRLEALPDPRDPTVMRHSMMDTPEKLLGLLEQAGIGPARVWRRTLVHAWTVNDLLATQIHCGLPSRRLRSLSVQDQRTCTDRVRVRFGRLTEDELRYRVEVLYAIASLPA